MPLRIGDTFAGYSVLRLLGAGGMGEVYLVQHPRLPRQEALKVLRPEFSHDASFRERFIREADLASGLRHPHIVGIHDRGEHDDQLWIAMDYIDGTDLSHLLEQRYPQGMPVGHVLPIVTAVASALDYAHKKGLLHRDVKPANIIVADLDTDDPKTFLADFGIARPLDDASGITTTNMTVGTVAYAAPEQLMGDPIDGRADQYALAATTYHLLTGSQLYPNSNPAVVISRHLNAPAPLLVEVRPELASLDPVLSTGLAKNPGDRFTSSADFARTLVEAAGPAGASTTLAPAARRSHLISEPDSSATPKGSAIWATRPRWLVGGSVAAVLLLLGCIGVLWKPWRQPELNTAPSTSAQPTASAPSGTAVAPPSLPTSANHWPPVTTTVAAPTVTVTARPTLPAAVGFSASEQEFLDAVASLNAANGYTTGPMYLRAIGGDVASKQQQDRSLVQRGYELCAALDDGLDSAAARQRVLGPLDDHSIDMFDYYGAIFIGYATYRLCPEHSGKTGQI
jgi:serine/threonine-protein kinase